MGKPRLFLAPSSGANLLLADEGYLDDGTDYQLLALSDRLAIAGEGGEVAFYFLYVSVLHERAVPIRITPIIDGVSLDPLDYTLANPAGNARTKRILEVPLLVSLPSSVTGFATLGRFAPRGTWIQVRIETQFVAAAATLTTALTGANNDLVFTAVTKGPRGNDITVRYVDPGAASAALSVSVSGSAITVNLATNAGSAITSTAAQVKAAIDAKAEAAALVTVANAAANDGSGVVTALAATNLAGGVGADYLAVESVEVEHEVVLESMTTGSNK